jgi:hypothetical protein
MALPKEYGSFPKYRRMAPVLASIDKKVDTDTEFNRVSQ